MWNDQKAHLNWDGGSIIQPWYKTFCLYVQSFKVKMWIQILKSEYVYNFSVKIFRNIMWNFIISRPVEQPNGPFGRV